MFTLRPATQADQTAIRLLIRRVGINPLALHWPRFILAVDGQGSMIACGQVKLHADGSRELASIAVVPEWRGRGVASAVINRLLEDHPGILYLTCRSSLGPFYTRFGFRRLQDFSEMPHYFRRLYRLAGIISHLHLINREMWVMVRP